MTKKTVVQLLLQTALGFTLLFLGWGFDDLGGFFAHPARASLLGVALLGLVWIFAWRLNLRVFRKGKRPVGRQRLGLALLMAFALNLVWFLPYSDRRAILTFAAPDALRYLGVALYLAGNVLAFVALRTLGKQYSGYVTLQDDHQLVQTGIYGVIRHPIYLRAFLAAVGLPLVFRSWLFVPLLVAVGFFVAHRIQQEEKLLAEQFGAEYEAYQRRTWRLLPYVY